MPVVVVILGGLLLGGGAVVLALASKRKRRRSAPATSTQQPKLVAQNRGIASRPEWPGRFPALIPGVSVGWTPKEAPEKPAGLVANLSWDAAEILRDGYRLFPALVPGTNRTPFLLANGWYGSGARLTWERGDSFVALKAAAVLFDAAERAPAGRLQTALYEGAAGLDAAAASVLVAEGAEISENAEFFQRLRAKRAAYDARMRKIVNKGLDEFKNLNWISFLGTMGEVMGFTAEAFYDAVRQVFRGSHGGPPALHLSLPWTPAAADDYAHRAYYTARIRGLA